MEQVEEDSEDEEEEGWQDVWKKTVMKRKMGVWEAAHLAQPTVLSELLDAKADPNCCRPPQRWWVPDLGLYDQYTPLHMVINRLDGAL